MTKPVRIHHGPFGRVVVYRMDRSLVVHAHPQAHLLVKIGGADATFQVSDKIWPLTDNFAVGVNAWEPHAYLHSDEREPTLLLVFYIEPLWLLRTSEGRLQGSQFRCSTISTTPEIHAATQSVLATTLYSAGVGSGGEGTELEIFTILDMAMDASARLMPADGVGRQRIQQFSVPRIGRVGDFRVRRAMAYIHQNIGNEFDFTEVARQAGLSRPHFFELFRSHTSLTPNQYLNMVRMEQAFRELSQSDSTICEVAANLGFSAQSNFTRFFRDHHGVSPSQYRRFATGLLPNP